MSARHPGMRTPSEAEGGTSRCYSASDSQGVLYCTVWTVLSIRPKLIKRGIMKVPRSNSRDRILAAAAEVARESGPGSLSLDAVAARAGVSKGGLLYNFPSKAKLMQALVEEYLRGFEQALDTARATENGESPLAAYIRLSATECREEKPSASWIFSAIAEDPEFLTPIKAFRRQVFARLKAETPDFKKL